MQDIVITGGGITGLSAAYMAARAGMKVTLLEADGQFGGLLNTFATGDARLERFYHHFFTHDLELLWLLKELGLEEQLHFTRTSMGMFSNGQLFPFQSAKDLMKFSPLGWKGKLLFGLTSLYLSRFANWKKYEDVPCLQWFKTRAGAQATRIIWQPMLEVKFGPYADKVPLSWMIGRLRQRVNSRKSGKEQLGYLKGSLQLLVDSLLERLSQMGVELVSHCPVENVRIENNQITAIDTPKGTWQGKQFLFTIPGFVLANVLPDTCKAYSQKLKQIQYFGAICLVLEMKKPLSNYYWLNISDSDSPFGGVIEQTNFVSPAEYGNRHIAYLSRYFAPDEKTAFMDDEEITRRMLDYLPQIFPDFHATDIIRTHFFKTYTAATVCDIGFSEKIPSCQSPVDNMFLANMSHVYPDERSVNNSIKVAYEALRTMGIPQDFLKKSNSLSAKTGF